MCQLTCDPGSYLGGISSVGVNKSDDSAQICKSADLESSLSPKKKTAQF